MILHYIMCRNRKAMMYPANRSHCGMLMSSIVAFSARYLVGEVAQLYVEATLS